MLKNFRELTSAKIKKLHLFIVKSATVSFVFSTSPHKKHLKYSEKVVNSGLFISRLKQLFLVTMTVTYSTYLKWKL